MTYWIATDLDGTLLDHTNYSYAAALPALELCKKTNTPIVLNTSKTQAETKALHQALQLSTPFVVENGSALVFDSDLSFECPLGLNDPTKKTQIFGQPRLVIIEFIEAMRSKHNIKLRGFNDLSINDIVEHTGLSIENAKLAADKHYSEPFIWHDSESKLTEFKKLAEQEGLTILQGGRFYHLQGQTDKSKPLKWLQNNLELLFQSTIENPKLICLGDNHNDTAMLNIADYPVWVKSAKNPPELTNKKNAIYTKEFGPKGWNDTILNLLTAVN